MDDTSEGATIKREVAFDCHEEWSRFMTCRFISFPLGLAPTRVSTSFKEDSNLLATE